MSIIATASVPVQNRLDASSTVQPVTPACPPWCTDHIVDEVDGGVVHSSGRITVQTMALRETAGVDVEVYRLDLPPELAAESPEAEIGCDGKPTVNMDGGNIDMTPAQTLELAAVLIHHASLALDSDGRIGTSPMALAVQCGLRASLRAATR